MSLANDLGRGVGLRVGASAHGLAAPGVALLVLGAVAPGQRDGPRSLSVHLVHAPGILFILFFSTIDGVS